MTIDPRDCFEIPKTDYVIAKRESDKGFDWEKTHEVLHHYGWWMPPPSLFMLYYKHVRDAAEGNTALFDGNHQKCYKSEAEDQFVYLSTRACSWLNAKFEKNEDGFKLITYGPLISFNLEGKKERFDFFGEDQIMESPLERAVDKDQIFVDLKFNAQGFPRKKSRIQELDRRKNLLFEQPENGSVAAFIATHFNPTLSFGKYPHESYPSLGVFACHKWRRRE